MLVARKAVPLSRSANSLVAAIIFLWLTIPVGSANEAPRFGGPNSVERIIETDRTPKGSFIESQVFAPVESWLDELEKKSGFSLGMDYSAVTVHASDTLAGADDSASGGMVRLYGRWNLVGDGQTSSGGIVYKLEHRHDYGEPAPSGFYLGNVGYAGLNAPPWSDQGERVTNLYWR